MWCNITNYSECLVYVYSQSLCLYPDNDDNSNHPIKLKFVKPLLCARSCARDWSLSSVQFSRSVLSDSLRCYGLQHSRLPCPSPTPRAYSNSCPSSQWCYPTILSSVIPFSSCLQSFTAWGSFPMCQFFTSGVQSIGASASAPVLPMNIQDWFPLGLTALGRTNRYSRSLMIPALAGEIGRSILVVIHLFSSQYWIPRHLDHWRNKDDDT